MLKVAQSCGVEHPSLVSGKMVDILLGTRQHTPLWQVAGYDDPSWGMPSAAQQAQISGIMTGAPQGGSAPVSGTSRAGRPGHVPTHAPGHEAAQAPVRVRRRLPILPG
ncbi:hypothetical protein [Ornithinimicrobium avium]|uniref:Uncharacterized protein n=1 Tax=Ornithinimicrobium avium TaxID=2283195 RepID=A0A345NJ73_9MICO|nr:hypothetical protein [Ornithinimicrobium avium]AXH95081.1 hypothetical protein DV701_01935 [Ornithinimicrobium avium]